MADDAPRHDLVPAGPGAPAAPAYQEWGDAPAAPSHRSPLERPLAAVRRYKWLMLGVFSLAVAGGAVATQLVEPKYEVRATIWINSETPLQEKNGPIRSNELLNSAAWVELLRSYRIADAVVRQLSLYVRPKHAGDSTFFRNFSIGDRFVPGTYTLQVSGGRKWRLTHDEMPAEDTGVAEDSIGEKLGLNWQLSEADLSRLHDRKVTFTLSTPRETSVELMKRLNARLPEKSNFLWLTLHDPNPALAARTLNTWVEEYVKVAGDLKKRNMVEFANILGGQLAFAETSLKDAEAALESFRVATITMPAEGGPVAAGVEVTRDPALTSYFDQKIEYDNLRHDREALERVLASAAGGAGQYEGALLIPSVAQNPGAEQLRELFKQLYKEQADLTAGRQVYTDEYPAVRDLSRRVETLRMRTIPQQANQLLAQLKAREAEYQARIANASGELQAIPARTIEEMRLRRAVSVAEGLYTTLKSRHAEARLAEASAVPDVNVLDSAIAPLRPTKNTAPRIMLFAVAAGVAAAVGLALLLDATDKRLRYPEQASDELGLAITGAIPKFPKKGINANSPEQVTQLIESFRTIRMNVVQTLGVPGSLAISSPSPSDGKSFVASNLAMSFAEAGFRTLLIDGDTRRGTLHDLFGLKRTPGLTDFLMMSAEREAIIYPTAHERLSIIPSGNPRRRSPELLGSQVLKDLVASLRTEYDAVIFDTPPLAAGIDGYAIAAAAGSLLVVLRVGQTERRMASAKMLLADRLPIRILGSVLNAAPANGEYEYYGYVDGYAVQDEEHLALTR